jgi:PHD/YefM family antitoxin component YafN of YafNO toxin-antitoxin module
LSWQREPCFKLSEITVEPVIGVVLLKPALKHVHDSRSRVRGRGQDIGNLAPIPIRQNKGLFDKLANIAIIALLRPVGNDVMITELPNIQELPRQNASQVKNKWADMVRLVHQSGSVAVTNHSAVEMVLLDARTYQQLTEEIQALKAREQIALDELTNRFNARLAVLQQPDAGQKLNALLDAKGVLKKRPKAGASY